MSDYFGLYSGLIFAFITILLLKIVFDNISECFKLTILKI